MSVYQERWVLQNMEGTWGVWNTPNTFPNYLLNWDATTTEGVSEEEIIAGARDLKSRTFLEEGVVARMVVQLTSSKYLEYCLGSHAVTNTVTPFTIGPNATLPSASFFRGLTPAASGETGTLCIGYYGMKVDTWELTLERGEDVRLEMNWAGRGATIPQTIGKPTPSVAIPVFAFYHGEVTYAGTTLAYLNRIVVSGDNNLEARLSAGSLSYRPVALREGGLDISGRMSIDQPLGTFASAVLARGEATIVVALKGATAAQGTITMTIKNCGLSEYPDEMDGLSPIEAEIPFTARGSSGNDVVTVVQTSSSGWPALPY